MISIKIALSKLWVLSKGLNPISRHRKQKRATINHLGGPIELIITFTLKLIIPLIIGVGTTYRSNRSCGRACIWGTHAPK